MKLYARVKGRVQGVGFRYFVQRQAWKLGLDGWVRNLRDGTVEIEAIGPPEQLDQLEKAIRRGPPGAYVEHVSCYRTEGEPDGSGFSIRFV